MTPNVSYAPGVGNDSVPIDIAIVSAPYHHGQDKAGVDLAPAELARLLATCTSNNRVKIVGATECERVPEHLWEDVKAAPKKIARLSRVREARAVGHATHLVHVAVKEALSSYDESTSRPPFILTLGGDHSVALGSVSAVASQYGEELVVFWIDAHADLNTPETSVSGNLHGCPVAFLLGFDGTHEGVVGHGWLKTVKKPIPPEQSERRGPAFIHPSRLVYLGLRDVEDSEKAFIREHAIAAYYMDELCRRGIKEVMEEALHRVDPNGERPIHMSFDIDSIDPKFAPATGTAVPDGLSLEQAKATVEFLANTGRMRSMDLVEVNLELARSQKERSMTLASARTILAAAFVRQAFDNSSIRHSK